MAGPPPLDGTQPVRLPEGVEVRGPARRPGRRRLRIILAVVILLVLLVIGFFVAEGFLRTYANDTVRDRIVSALDLPNDDGVAVDLGAGSLILQALAGSINDASVTIDALAVGDLSGSAVVTASGVPLDETAPVRSLAIDFSLDEGQLAALTDSVGGVDIDSVVLEGSDIRITTSISLLALDVPVDVGLAPSAEGGQIVLTPVDVVAGGQDVSVDALRDGPLSGLVGTLLDPQEICVADQLPAALVVTDVRVDGQRLVISLDGDGAVLGGDALQTKGTCPAG